MNRENSETKHKNRIKSRDQLPFRNDFIIIITTISFSPLYAKKKKIQIVQLIQISRRTFSFNTQMRTHIWSFVFFFFLFHRRFSFDCEIENTNNSNSSNVFAMKLTNLLSFSHIYQRHIERHLSVKIKLKIDNSLKVVPLLSM